MEGSSREQHLEDQFLYQQQGSNRPPQEGKEVIYCLHIWDILGDCGSCHLRGQHRRGLQLHRRSLLDLDKCAPALLLLLPTDPKEE